MDPVEVAHPFLHLQAISNEILPFRLVHAPKDIHPALPLMFSERTLIQKVWGAQEPENVSCGAST